MHLQYERSEDTIRDAHISTAVPAAWHVHGAEPSCGCQPTRLCCSSLMQLWQSTGVTQLLLLQTRMHGCILQTHNGIHSMWNAIPKCVHEAEAHIKQKLQQPAKPAAVSLCTLALTCFSVCSPGLLPVPIMCSTISLQVIGIDRRQDVNACKIIFFHLCAGCCNHLSCAAPFSFRS